MPRSMCNQGTGGTALSAAGSSSPGGNGGTACGPASGTGRTTSAPRAPVGPYASAPPRVLGRADCAGVGRPRPWPGPPREVGAPAGADAPLLPDLIALPPTDSSTCRMRSWPTARRTWCCASPPPPGTVVRGGWNWWGLPEPDGGPRSGRSSTTRRAGGGGRAPPARRRSGRAPAASPHPPRRLLSASPCNGKDLSGIPGPAWGVRQAQLLRLR